MRRPGVSYLSCLIAISLGFLVLSSQGQDLTQAISLKFKNEKLKQVIEKIGSLTNIKFSYNPQSLPLERKITGRFESQPVKQVLDRIFQPLDISWVFVEQQIILKPGKAVSQDDGIKGKNDSVFTVSGFLRDKATGEALIGANVYTSDRSKGTMTNEYGFYSLHLRMEKYQLIFSFLGYATSTHEIYLSGNLQLSVNLEETQVEVPGVEIIATNEDPVNETLGNIRFSSKTLSQLPVFLGNLDIVKSLQAIPGVRTYGDGSSFFFVRGGSRDQNLMMIDEIPIYNPSHVFGFVSIPSPDAINDLQVYKGDFPARYGGRASSVIDIKTREGNVNRFSATGNLCPYASNLSLEGPIVKEKASYHVSGRFSTLNWLNYLADREGEFNLYFYDINGKVNYRLNARNRLFLTLYGGEDVFNRIVNTTYRTYGISWRNLAGALRWNHIFGPRLFSNTSLVCSAHHYYLYLSKDQNPYWHSGIQNITIKTDLTCFINPSNTFRGGIAATRYGSDPGNITRPAGEHSEGEVTVSKYQAYEYVAYLSNEQQLTPRLKMDYGIRIPYWQPVGPATIYSFDANHVVIDSTIIAKNKYYRDHLGLEPRIGLSLKAGNHQKIGASYSRMSQSLRQLTYDTGPFTGLDVWTITGPNIKPLIADQVSAGYFQTTTNNSFDFSLEGYYKWYQNYFDYADHANLLFNPYLEGQLRFGQAFAYGLELMLRKTQGKLNGWVGYAYSRSFAEISEVNGGKSYPATFDSPHNICISLSYHTRTRWKFSVSWLYMTGNPYTAPIGFYSYNGYTIPVYGEKNNQRHPDYHRLDCSASFRINRNTARFNHHLTLSVYNLYGRSNPYSISFNKFRDQDGYYVVSSNQWENPLLVPTVISVAGVIPSINYQFRF